MLRGLPRPGGHLSPAAPPPGPLVCSCPWTYQRASPVASGAGVTPATRALGSNMKLVGYRRVPTFHLWGSEGPHRCVWSWTHDGIVARSGQLCLGVGVAPRSLVREMRSSAPTSRPPALQPSSPLQLPQPAPYLQPRSGGSAARAPAELGQVQKPWPWPLGFGAQHKAAAAALLA